MKRFALIFSALFLLSSCGEEAVQSIQVGINDGNWNMVELLCEDVTEPGFTGLLNMESGGFDLDIIFDGNSGKRTWDIGAPVGECNVVINFLSVEYEEGGMRITESAAECTGPCVGFEGACAAPEVSHLYAYDRNGDTLKVVIPETEVAAADPCQSGWAKKATFIFNKTE